jgi:hypothetical protein
MNGFHHECLDGCLASERSAVSVELRSFRDAVGAVVLVTSALRPLLRREPHLSMEFQKRQQRSSMLDNVARKHS